MKCDAGSEIRSELREHFVRAIEVDDLRGRGLDLYVKSCFSNYVGVALDELRRPS